MNRTKVSSYAKRQVKLAPSLQAHIRLPIICLSVASTSTQPRGTKCKDVLKLAATFYNKLEIDSINSDYEAPLKHF